MRARWRCRVPATSKWDLDPATGDAVKTPKQSFNSEGTTGNSDGLTELSYTMGATSSKLVHIPTQVPTCVSWECGLLGGNSRNFLHSPPISPLLSSAVRQVGNNRCSRRRANTSLHL